MKEYTQPKCDCGQKLIIIESVYTYGHRKIKSDGIPYDNHKLIGSQDIEYIGLKCEKCGVTYIFNQDNFGRVMRE